MAKQANRCARSYMCGGGLQWDPCMGLHAVHVREEVNNIKLRVKWVLNG
jgi:hypothetical protein